MDDIENLLDDALDGFGVSVPGGVATQQNRTSRSPCGTVQDKDTTGEKRGAVVGATLDTSTDNEGTAIHRGVQDACMHESMGEGHDSHGRSFTHVTSSSSSSPSSKLKFDPLGPGTRKKKVQAAEETQSAVERELNMLMQELLGSPGDVDVENKSERVLQETLDALKAAGLGEGDVRGGDQGVQDQEDSLSSALVDGIMRQLLSKDILYQPMREIGERYPPWLQANKETLDPDEYANYAQQYTYIQKICGIYEADEDNFNDLMTLLQEMQSCGQPPQAIIDELSPEDATSVASSFTGGTGLPGGQCTII